MTDPTLERSFSEPNLSLQCACGWSGHDDDIENWDVQESHDRTVRCCPACGEPVPEWGTLRPIDGAARIARGPLRASLIAAGYLSE